MTFTIIDKTTGKAPDLRAIALEDWAINASYGSTLGFLIDEEGILYLMDRCGSVVECPQDRFIVEVKT
jgi:hypothetical protein